MKPLTDEDKKTRSLYAGRLRTPAQIIAAREYQRLWAQRNPGKKHSWRRANPGLAREAARRSMRKLRSADPEKYRNRSREYAGFPEPTRPEPLNCEICGKPCKS